MFIYIIRYNKRGTPIKVGSRELRSKRIERLEDIDNESFRKFVEKEGLLDKGRKQSSILKFLDLHPLLNEEERVNLSIDLYKYIHDGETVAYALLLDIKVKLKEDDKGKGDRRSGIYTYLILADERVKPIGSAIKIRVDDEMLEEIKEAIEIEEKEDALYYLLYIPYIYALSVELNEALMDITREIREMEITPENVKKKETFKDILKKIRKYVLVITAALDRIDPSYIRSFSYIEIKSGSVYVVPLGPRIVKIRDLYKNTILGFDNSFYSIVERSKDAADEALLTLNTLIQLYYIEYEILEKEIDKEMEKYNQTIPLLILTALSSLFLAADGLISIYPWIRDRLSILGRFLLGSRAAYAIMIFFYEPERQPLKSDDKLGNPIRTSLGSGSLVAYTYLLVKDLNEILHSWYILPYLAVISIILSAILVLYLYSRSLSSILKVFLSPIAMLIVIAASYVNISLAGFLGRLLIHRGIVFYEKAKKLGGHQIKLFWKNLLYEDLKARSREKRLRFLRDPVRSL